MQFMEDTSRAFMPEGQLSKTLKQIDHSGVARYKKIKQWISAGGRGLYTVQQTHVITLLHMTYFIIRRKFCFFYHVLFFLFQHCSLTMETERSDGYITSK